VSSVVVHVAVPKFRQLLVKAGWKTTPFVALVTLCPCPRVTATRLHKHHYSDDKLAF